MQVTSSERDDPSGPYGEFTFINISGYNVSGPGNIYFGSIRNHPLAPQTMMLGLFPVNEGTLRKWGVPEDDEGMPRASPDPDCKGTCYIALSHSCDGIHWSKLVKVFASTRDRGRTFDQPVSGFVHEGSVVHMYVHRDVTGISPYAPTASRIVRLPLKVRKLRQLMAMARRELPDCSASAMPRAWTNLHQNSTYERYHRLQKVRKVLPYIRPKHLRSGNSIN